MFKKKPNQKILFLRKYGTFSVLLISFCCFFFFFVFYSTLLVHTCCQVPVILDATTFSIKLQKRRFLVLECLNQAPIDSSSGSSYGTSASCSGSSKTGMLDF